MTDIFSQQRRNRRITVLLIISFFVLVVAIGLSVDIYTAGSIDAVRFPLITAIAAGVAVINGLIAYYGGSSVVLRSAGAADLSRDDQTHRQLHNVVTEMALASGLPMPRICVIPDPAPNAFATGRSPSKAAVAVTQGLLDTMTRDELQAVVAHEMGHVRNNDIRTMTVVAVLLGTVALLTDWAIRTWRLGGVRRGRRIKGKGMHPVALLVLAAFVLLSPFISRIIAMAVSRSREFDADAASAEFTRNPVALATALEKIAADTSPVRAAHKGTAHMFISDPLKRKSDERVGFFSNLFSTHPPVEERVKKLRLMGYARERFGSGKTPWGAGKANQAPETRADHAPPKAV